MLRADIFVKKEIICGEWMAQMKRHIFDSIEMEVEIIWKF